MAFLGTILLACVLALAALHLGSGLGAQWSALSTVAAGAGLQRLWMSMQGVWLAAMLLPVGIGILTQGPPQAALRPFALRPFQVFLADLLAHLLDLPALLALCMTLPLIAALLMGALWGQALVALIAFALLALQTGALARLLAALGALFTRRARRWVEIPALNVLLMALLCVGAPPAFASLTTPAGQRLQSRFAPLASTSSSRFTALFPSRMAARSVVAMRRADYPDLLASLGGLAACLGLTSGGALLALRGVERPAVERARRASPRPATPRSYGWWETRSGPLPQIAAVVQTEFRLLLRRPEGYLPLRRPASLLLLGVFAFLSPDLSRDPVYNLKELLGIGAILYTLLWQMQLLCNRFGTEAGTATLLFGLSVPRRRLILGRNLALFLLLWPLDSGVTVGLSAVAEALRNLPQLLLTVPVLLLILTALGNLVSVVQPFPIARPVKRSGVEPPASLSWGYVAVGVAAGALLIPVFQMLAWNGVGIVAVTGYLCALYAASLFASAALLAQQEQGLVAQLDGRTAQ